ncbi:class I SAM-dependent methyltransferase [Candidatus Halobeggiatoa sp. HSG11]|nr:class I SAM-dependent methyltransferase [Candidatus Halobeggiatoa sp. HSG11]
MKTTLYDEIPYTKLIYQQTQPNHIATTATLFGMQPPPVATCRMLELGCASGINTIAMAQAIPKGEFVGIDYSKTQIAEGQANIQQLGLKNITLQAMDFSDINLGKFDYIVSHGVYSWISAALRIKLLEICKQHLQPNGVVYISYNTYPGWHTDHMLRKMMLYRTKHLSDPKAKLKQAKELLDFFIKVNKRKYDSYSLSLRKELEHVSKLNENYLVHEYLEEHNEPILFSEFIEQAKQNDLQYITDMRTPFVATEDFTFQDSFDLIETEQYLDFLRNTSFRETLLCNQDIVLDRNLSPNKIDKLNIAAPLKPSVKTEDIKPDEMLTKFANLAGETVLSVTSPLLKAVCLCLGEAWPQNLSFDDLMQQVNDLLFMMDKETVISPADIDEVKTMLIEFYLKKIVELSVYPPKFTLNISEFPIASPIARLQSQYDKQVTNLRYEIFTLDLATRHILQHLDGKHSTVSLLKIMQESIDNGDLILYQGEDKKEPMEIDSEKLQNYLIDYVTNILQDLAKKAYLVG